MRGMRKTCSAKGRDAYINVYVHAVYVYVYVHAVYLYVHAAYLYVYAYSVIYIYACMYIHKHVGVYFSIHYIWKRIPMH